MPGFGGELAACPTVALMQHNIRADRMARGYRRRAGTLIISFLHK
jgi:hypothetical protein